MMRPRRLFASPVLMFSLLSTAAVVGGCRKKAADAPPPSEKTIEAQEIQAADAHPPEFYNRLSDEALLGEHATDGVELALKMDAASYANGAPIGFHILIRDAGATEPIAAGLCSGLSLTWQRLDDNTADQGAVDNPHCFDTIPSPDETALVRGAIKRVDITQRQASHASFAPGRYVISLVWQPYAAGRGKISGREAYATVKSNAILFTVLP